MNEHKIITDGWHADEVEISKPHANCLYIYSGFSTRTAKLHEVRMNWIRGCLDAGSVILVAVLDKSILDNMSIVDKALYDSVNEQMKNLLFEEAC